MADFLCLFRNDPGNQAHSRPSPEDMQKMMRATASWMGALQKGGHLKDPGSPLEGAGKVIRGTQVLTDGPYVESKDVVGGYMILTADSLDQAEDLFKDSPIFMGGGMVEIRPIHPMKM